MPFGQARLARRHRWPLRRASLRRCDLPWLLHGLPLIGFAVTACRCAPKRRLLRLRLQRCLSSLPLCGGALRGWGMSPTSDPSWLWPLTRFLRLSQQLGLAYFDSSDCARVPDSSARDCNDAEEAYQICSRRVPPSSPLQYTHTPATVLCVPGQCGTTQLELEAWRYSMPV